MYFYFCNQHAPLYTSLLKHVQPLFGIALFALVCRQYFDYTLTRYWQVLS